MTALRRIGGWLSVFLWFLPSARATVAEDKFLWLEEIESEPALKWVKERNERTAKWLKADPRYAKIEAEVRKILLATDRLQYPTLRQGYIYNFWQDAEHVRGLWRRTKPEEYEKANPTWETIVDLDDLTKKENENWVWKGAHCFPEDPNLCLLSLSRGGKDAVVVREFHVGTKTFVKDGFFLPEAKSTYAWKDKDTLLIGTDFGPGSMTLSGYPRLVKIWKRGTPLAQAKLIYETSEKDVEVSGYTLFRPEGNVTLISRAPSFFESESFVVGEDLNVTRVPFPIDADFRGVFQGQFLAQLRKSWKTGGKTFGAGTLVSLPIAKLRDPKSSSFVEIVYRPHERASIAGVSSSRDHLFVNVLDNVIGQILRIERKGGWKAEKLAFPDRGTTSIVSANDFESEIVVQYSSYAVPSTLFKYDEVKGAIRQIKKLPDRFDATGVTVDQQTAKSKDGTLVPYFIVKPKGLVANGKNPTLLYGYGGFEVSELPNYLEALGKVWTEKGGVFVVANIRGGGEFGPKWHQAALKEKRQKAFDDFYAVAKSLADRKITSPRHLAIRGGSNGGLLMGAAFTQHPEAYNGVLCEVPLLDMLRYHKLLAGNSWMGEYGDPDDPKYRAAILKYSPYQNLKKGAKYPKVFFYTSTKDDRVHPGHARKMAARMEELGYDLLYYENIEGGHGAAANLEQRIVKSAMQYTYLFQQLTE